MASYNLESIVKKTHHFMISQYLMRVTFQQIKNSNLTLRATLLFGKKRQSPAFMVTMDQGTSETLGYFNRSTCWIFMRENPPTFCGGSHALYILSSYLYSISFHSLVPLYKQLIALYASLWSILLVPPPLIHKSTSTSLSFKRPQVRGGMTVTSRHMGVGSSETM